MGNVMELPFNSISSFQTVSYRSFWTHMDSPSPFQVLLRSSHEVSDLLRGNGSEETKFLSSHEFRQILTPESIVKTIGKT